MDTYSPLWYLIVIACIVIITVVAASLTQRFFNRLLAKASTRMRVDPTNYRFIKHTIVSLIYLLGLAAVVYTIPSLRTLANSMLAGAGILAFAIGFAAKDALGNIVGGAFIIIFRPFGINQRIGVGGHVGIVEDITLRHTVIRNFENKRVVIPNSVISNEVLVNETMTDERVVRFVDIGISYGSDINLARHIMTEEAMKHPLRIDGRTQEQIDNGEPEVRVRVVQLADYFVLLRAYAWVATPADAFALNCDLNESIKERFSAEGVEVPFPYRTVVYKSDLPTEKHWTKED